MAQPRGRTRLSNSGAMRIGAGVLCLAVTVIHVIDQGGLPGSKTPGYVGIGYYLLEAAGFIAAVLLWCSRSLAGWLLAGGVALGPLLGYVWSRGPGMPNYTQDRGHWMYPLAVVSVIVEVALLALVLWALRSIRHQVR